MFRVWVGGAKKCWGFVCGDEISKTDCGNAHTTL